MIKKDQLTLDDLESILNVVKEPDLVIKLLKTLRGGALADYHNKFAMRTLDINNSLNSKHSTLEDDATAHYRMINELIAYKGLSKPYPIKPLFVKRELRAPLFDVMKVYLDIDFEEFEKHFSTKKSEKFKPMVWKGAVSKLCAILFGYNLKGGAYFDGAIQANKQSEKDEIAIHFLKKNKKQLTGKDFIDRLKDMPIKYKQDFLVAIKSNLIIKE